MLQKQQNTFHMRWEALNAVNTNFYPTWTSIQILAHGLLKTQILCEQIKIKLLDKWQFMENKTHIMKLDLKIQ
jgi:hypothetical protein